MPPTYAITEPSPAESPGSPCTPLSYTQQQLWFAEQIDPDQSLYTEALAVRIRGSVDPGVIERALREILRRHEALRTVFPLVGGRPVQRVLPPDVPMRFDRVSMDDVPEARREQELLRRVTEFVEERLDLTRELLTRAMFVSVAPDDQVLVVTLHHLVCDGLSGRIVFAELGRLYEAFAAGEPSPLPEPELQYADFTEWERDLYASGYLDDDIAYWRERLAGVEPTLELPARRPRPETKGVRGTRAMFPLADAALRTRITGFCREHRVSLYVLTLAAFAATVSRCTGQRDLVFGTLAANRARSELENVVGQFTNTLPMRIDLTGDPALLDLVGRAARTSEEAIEHGLVALGKIVELTAPRRDPSRNALIQHLFLTSGQPASEATWGSASVAPFDVPRNRGRLDTIVEIEERGPEVVTWVEYDTQLLDHREVEQLMHRFGVVLAQWLDQPELRLSQLTLPDQEEISEHARQAPVRTGPAAGRTPDGTAGTRPETGRGTGAAPAAAATGKSPLHELLGQMWREVLGVDGVALDDDFFELGGHSMLSARLIERVRDALRVDVPLRMLFTHSRFGEFAEALRTSFPEIDDVLVLMDGMSDEETAGLLRSVSSQAPDEPAVPAERARRFPLSSSQLHLWLMEYLRGAGITYTIPLEFRITGPLDVDALRRSIRRVVERHDMLRVTVELTGDGDPVQVVHDAVDLDIPFTDLVAGSPEVAEEIRRRIGYFEFALDKGPLLAAHVVREAPERHTLYIVFHHLVMDERSMTLFMRELSTVYSAEVRGTPGPGALPVQIGDYVRWERAQLSGESLNRLRSFWRTRLQGVPELVLPTDLPRPANLTFDGEFLYRPQERALFDEVAALAKGHHVTPFIVFTAATSLLLHRLSGQDRFIIGMPSDSRGMPGSEELIGCFINVLPIRVDCTGSPTFAELTRRLRDEVVAAYDHRALPLSAIVDAAGAARTHDRLPLFQVTAELQVEGWMPLELPGCAVDYSFIGHGTARYDMAFHAMVKADSFEVCAEVNSGVYTFDTGYRRLDQLSRLLRQVVRDPHRALADYELG